MTFALNPTSDQSEALFQQAAITQNGTSATVTKSTSQSGLSTGAKVGIALGVSIPVIIIAILAFFFFARRKKNVHRDGDLNPTVEWYVNDHKVSGEDSGATDVKVNKPKVPPKGSEVHGDSRASELPGYSPIELPASRLSLLPQHNPNAEHKAEELESPISTPEAPRRKPVGGSVGSSLNF